MSQFARPKLIDFISKRRYNPGMVSLLPVVVTTVNFSHDIATAVLAVSAVSLWTISRSYPPAPNRKTDVYFVRVYHVVTRMAQHSLVWILIAGVPRIYFYTEYDWNAKAGDLQVVAIIIKHVFMFLFASIGLFYWSKAGRKAKKLSLKP